MPPADDDGTRPRDEIAERGIAAQRDVVLDPTRPVVATCGAQLVGVDAGVQRQLGDAGCELEERALDASACTRWAHDHLVGEHHALFRREPAEREPGDTLVGVVAQAQRQPEVDRQLEVGVEEVGAWLEGRRDGW